MEMNSFAKFFDHTLLRADASRKEIRKLCEEAVKYGFASVCVNSANVAFARRSLDEMTASGDPSFPIACVVGFPLGAMSAEAKLFEARKAFEDGAAEIDMVINIAAVKSGDPKQQKAATDEIAAISAAAKEYGGTLKVILETGYYGAAELALACQIALDGGADYLKTSTGFGSGGAEVSDVMYMKAAADRYNEEHGLSEAANGLCSSGDASSDASSAASGRIRGPVRVKASGGIRDLKTALAMIKAGASRLGTSATVKIIEEYLAAKPI